MEKRTLRHSPMQMFLLQICAKKYFKYSVVQTWWYLSGLHSAGSESYKFFIVSLSITVRRFGIWGVGRNFFRVSFRRNTSGSKLDRFLKIIKFSSNICYIQWGSEIRPFKKWKHLKYKLFGDRLQMVWFSKGRPIINTVIIFPHNNPHLWVQTTLTLTSLYHRPIVMVPTIWKPGPFKIQMFCPDFKWSGCVIQIPFEIRTIYNTTFFWPLEIRTCPDFRSHWTIEIWITY